MYLGAARGRREAAKSQMGLKANADKILSRKIIVSGDYVLQDMLFTKFQSMNPQQYAIINDNINLKTKRINST